MHKYAALGEGIDSRQLDFLDRFEIEADAQTLDEIRQLGIGGVFRLSAEVDLLVVNALEERHGDPDAGEAVADVLFVTGWLDLLWRERLLPPPTRGEGWGKGRSARETGNGWFRKSR